MDSLPLARAVPDRTTELAPPAPPGPQRPSRPRRQTAAQKKAAFDVEDHIATVDMANFEDSQVTRRRRGAVIGVVAVSVLAVAVLAWAFWPSSKPTPKPKAVVEKATPKVVEAPVSVVPSVVKVTFRGPGGTKVTVAGTAVTLGDVVELPPGPVTVRYVCPVKRKQKPRTLQFSPDIPATGGVTTIDVPCL